NRNRLYSTDRGPAAEQALFSTLLDASDRDRVVDVDAGRVVVDLDAEELGVALVDRQARGPAATLVHAAGGGADPVRAVPQVEAELSVADLRVGLARDGHGHDLVPAGVGEEEVVEATGLVADEVAARGELRVRRERQRLVGRGDVARVHDRPGQAGDDERVVDRDAVEVVEHLEQHPLGRPLVEREALGRRARVAAGLGALAGDLRLRRVAGVLAVDLEPHRLIGVEGERRVAERDGHVRVAARVVEPEVVEVAVALAGQRAPRGRGRLREDDRALGGRVVRRGRGRRGRGGGRGRRRRSRRWRGLGRRWRGDRLAGRRGARRRGGGRGRLGRGAEAADRELEAERHALDVVEHLDVVGAGDRVGDGEGVGGAG